jgi:peptidoglycan/xylan/chitin deacetylase (PgdA/CDA1 family)
MISGRQGILCLTFDNMGSAAAVGRGETFGRGRDDEGPTGYPEALDVLDRLGLKATFFIEGWNALFNPDAVRAVARQHEIGLHGWIHEVFHTLSREDAQSRMSNALAAFQRIDVDPIGFRAPGGQRGPYSMDLVRDLGLAFDSSVDHGPDDPIDAQAHPAAFILESGVPSVPWQWAMIDYYHYYMHPDGARTPDQLENYYIDRIDAAATAASLCTMILHPFVSFQEAERRAAIERVLGYAVAHPGIRVLTAGAVARTVVGARTS